MLIRMYTNAWQYCTLLHGNSVQYYMAKVYTIIYLKVSVKEIRK